MWFGLGWTLATLTWTYGWTLPQVYSKGTITNALASDFSCLQFMDNITHHPSTGGALGEGQSASCITFLSPTLSRQLLLSSARWRPDRHRWHLVYGLKKLFLPRMSTNWASCCVLTGMRAARTLLWQREYLFRSFLYVCKRSHLPSFTSLQERFTDWGYVLVDRVI